MVWELEVLELILATNLVRDLMLYSMAESLM